MSNAGKVFDSPRKASRELRLESEVHKLRILVGEFKLELKKSEEEFL
jgi:hypothetical protein